MLSWCLCLATVILAGVGGAEEDLSPPEASYKILMLLPVSSKSHRNVFMPLAEALADRGHKVVMLTNHPKASKHHNIMEIQHGLPHFREDTMNMFDFRKNATAGMNKFSWILPAMARDLYTLPEVKKLYSKRKEFDLMIVNHMFNEVIYPFVHEVPHITMATVGMDFRQSAILGNVLNPAYLPNMKFNFPLPMSAWHRFLNTLTQIAMSIYWRQWSVVPLVQKEIDIHFPDLPPLLELERNQSLALLNSHFSLETTLPLLPSQVEVGAMHCRPAKPLPEDLEAWISGGGPEGVIYFSLGSVTRGSSMPDEYRDAFIEAFRRLPHRVIWKYEGDLEEVSENVKIVKWLPQQDILDHDNVKVFITHGGLLSMQESIYHATPMLSVPIFADQPKNGKFVSDSGIGRMLIWEELTAELLVEALTDIIENPKYKENIEKMSLPLRDQLTTPLERAVFWSEYVIRHRGAPQLKCPAAKLSWVEFLMLDVLLALHVFVIVSFFILRAVLRAIMAKVFGSKDSKQKLE